MRILIVCTGNTCRSPMAALLLSELARRNPALADLQVESAGTQAEDEAPATSEAIASMRTRGLDLSRHRSRRLTDEIVARADVILAMTDQHLAQIAKFPSAVGRRVDTLGSFAGTGAVVEDPFGEGEAAYEACAAQLERLLELAAKRLGETS